jgi:hypothetical protein
VVIVAKAAVDIVHMDLTRKREQQKSNQYSVKIIYNITIYIKK